MHVPSAAALAPPTAGDDATPTPSSTPPIRPRQRTTSGLQAVLSDPNLAHSLQSVASPHTDAAALTARARFEHAVRRYYYQLTVGCHDQHCTNKLCRANPACQRLLPDAAAVLAVQLAARRRHFFCPRCPDDPDVAIPGPAEALQNAHVHPVGLAPPPPVTEVRSRGNRSASVPPQDATTRALRGRSPSPSPTPFLHSTLSSSAFASIFAPASNAPPVPPVPGKLPPTDDKAKTLRRNASADHLRVPGAGVESLKSAPGSAGNLPGLLGSTETTKPGSMLLDSFLSMTSRLTRSISAQILPASAAAANDAVDLTSATPQLPSSASAQSLVSVTESASESGGDESTTAAAQPQPAVVLKYITKDLWDQSVARLAAAPAVTLTDEAGTDEAAAPAPTDEDGGMTEEAHKFLLDSIKHVFSNSSALNHSFKVPASITENVHPSRLDLSSIRETYDLILAREPRARYRRCLTDAIELLLAHLDLNLGSAVESKSKLAQFLILLENPLLDDTAFHESLFRPLLQLITRLSPRAKAVLVQWWAAFPEPQLRGLVERLQGYLSAHYHAGPTRPDDAVVAVVRVLGLCYSANEVGNVMPYAAFYNVTLCAQMNFKDEYRAWRKLLDKSTRAPGLAALSSPIATAATATATASTSTPDQFSYFSYPFLLDPVAKARIMHIDAMVQMAQEYEDACVSQALVVHTQKMLLADAARTAQLEAAVQHMTNPYLVLAVRRTHLVADTWAQLAAKPGEWKKPLKVKFANEDGMDQGGVQKEFFQVLLAQLMDPLYGLFTYDESTRYSWLNAASLEPVRQFELVGIVLGLALYNGVIVDVRFPRLLYRRLLGDAPTLDDVKCTWPDLGRGLQQLLDWDDGDVEDVFMRSFDVSVAAYGAVRTVELKPGGSNLPVTNANRHEYVALYVDWVCRKSVEPQFRALRRGFLKVCGGYALGLCRPEEVEQLLCGQEVDLDMSALEKGCGYDDGYHAAHPTIRDFWSVVHAMDLPHKKMLLEFVTASDRVPLKGLGSLTFVVQRNGPDCDRLPTALTCFGRLLLPEYAGKEKMKRFLVTAIENAKGFGLV
ncbi:hypothetical protein AMAG_11111 [Allomyces macrogynus ATCC 38327]|uniref:HECT-type E3 ubiquitin transferase n=1 Tax=Allomyces macrogynus (strain ATCC 38327) TaxID=578462 RepID=A0A0L0SSH7_ALLM3|nr:hypothetical protein AMAG_11111 [Allomyces macrogynus ATCC 38327]|eukprot:KNE65493.1 hypothetical protein AMAG_11111 [Allomyces macrogynus ATCC 38327]